jgi:hypothetical protein
MPNTHPILIDGQWRPATVTDTFTATDPRTRQPLPDAYPVSGWRVRGSVAVNVSVTVAGRHWPSIKMG